MNIEVRLIAASLRTVRLLAVILTLAAPVARSAEGAAPVTTVDQVRRLAPDAVRLRVPVVLRAVVTYYDAGWNCFFVQDATGGIFVRGSGMEFPLARGQWIELTGVTAPGIFATGIEEPSIQIIEQSSLPEAHPTTIKELASGTMDAQFVEVRGVVRAISTVDKRAALHMHSGSNELDIVLRDVAPSDPQLLRLVGAEVRVNGVNGTVNGRDGHLKEIRLMASDLHDVAVEEALPEKPYSLPTSAMAEAAPSEHRIKIFGRIAAITNGHIVVADQTGQMRVRAPRRVPMWPGDMVEALGFPVENGGRVHLGHALYRVVAPAGRTNSISTLTRFDLPAPPYLPLLQTIEDVRSLPPEEASLQFPVRLRGIVTFHSPADNYLFIHDGMHGICVTPAVTNLAVRPGQIVEVTGYSDPGCYAPTVSKAQVKLLALGELPAPQERSYSMLTSGKDDSQWISIDGIVRSIQLRQHSLWLDIATSGGGFTAMVPSMDDPAAARHLVDAEIRVTGVCGAEVNQRRQITGVIVFTPALDYIRINHAAPRDPFSLPTRSIASLFQFNPDGKPGHRVKIKGVVTMQRRPETVYVKDATAPLWISLAHPSELKPGDELEVVGFPEVSGQMQGLHSAIFRKSGTAPVPTPVYLNMDQASSGALDANYVTMSARFVQLSHTPGPPTLIVQSKSTLFEAVLNQTNAVPAMQRLKPGSLLRLTGICSSQTGEHSQARSFRLLLTSEADVVVLHTPPWWTKQHAIVLAGLLVSLIAATLMWVILLRRHVRKQTAAIHQLNVNLERRVVERTSELEASNKELEAFSYSVSHDLRAPLRAINGFAQMLLNNTAASLDERSLRYLQKVAASGRKMGQLVDDLLAFSRLNRQPLLKTAIDLGELAREHLDDLCRQEPHREIKVDIRPLPHAQGDRALITQVLVNLLNNAWKFTQKNPHARIEIGAQGANGDAAYYVRDNGAGFDMNYAQKLFRVFHRLHSEEEFPGTGVGLAIVHRVITRHGGRVWAEARLNEGATFYFTLPADLSKKQP